MVPSRKDHHFTLFLKQCQQHAVERISKSDPFFVSPRRHQEFNLNLIEPHLGPSAQAVEAAVAHRGVQVRS